MQRLRAEDGGLDAVDVVRGGGAFGQLLQLVGHAGHGRGQERAGGAAHGQGVFGQGDGIGQAAARVQVVFDRLDVLVLGGRLQRGVIADGADRERAGIHVLLANRTC